MAWDHRCSVYCRPAEGIHCEVIRFWSDGPPPARMPTPADYREDLRRRHGIALVGWEPAREAPPVRPDEPPIGQISGRPMRHVCDWLIWYREEVR